MRVPNLLRASLLLASVAGGLGAQAVVKEVQFSPPAFYVGDAVRARIFVEADDDVGVQAPESPPEADWVDIKSVSVEVVDGGFLVLVDFVPFAAGTRSLPSLDLGTVQLRDVKVPTHSILEASYEGARDLRGQLLLPGTRLAVALALALIAMAPFLGYALVRLAWNWTKKTRNAYRIRRPARRLRRLLKKLRGGVGSESASEWFSELTDGLRTYFGAKIGHDCRSSTTAEIARMPFFTMGGTPAARLLDVLKNGDMVKFAGRFADDRSLERTLAAVESALGDWEKADDQLQ